MTDRPVVYGKPIDGAGLTTPGREPIVKPRRVLLKCVCGAIVIFEAGQQDATCPRCKSTVRSVLPAPRKGSQG